MNKFLLNFETQNYIYLEIVLEKEYKSFIFKFKLIESEICFRYGG